MGNIPKTYSYFTLIYNIVRCRAPISMHVFIMYSMQFDHSCSQVLPDLFSLEAMGILLLTLGKAAIKSLLWFHSNHLQVMVLLSMNQN